MLSRGAHAAPNRPHFVATFHHALPEIDRPCTKNRRNDRLSLRRLGGQRWIRTTEGVSQQIYSLPHLATLVFALFAFAMAKVGIKAENAKSFLVFMTFHA